MIAAVCMLALHGAVFVEQEYAGPFPVSVPQYGWHERSFRITDLDGDGATDILQASEVVFQRDGAFRNQNRKALPDFGESAICQVWNRDIYFRIATRLEVIRWDGTGWKRVLSQEVDWPAAGDIDTGDGPNEAGRAAVNKFGGYLLDLDSDGTPEIAVPGPDGVHIYRRKESFYEPAGLLDIYPPVRLEPRTDVALWPESDRVIQPPALSRSCEYRFVGDQVSVLFWERLPQSQLRFHTTRYALALQDDRTFILGQTTEWASEAVGARHMGYFWLNGDDDVDLCRIEWRRIYDSPLPMPILETEVSTDAGKEFVTIQMLASTTVPHIIDLDSDGRQDLVFQGTGYFDGGLRETVLRATSRRRVDLLVHVYLQSSKNTFSANPSVVHTFAVELDKPPIHRTEMVRKMYHGAILNMEGDFDGDGYRDAAVHDRPERVSVFLGSAEEFDKRPYAVVPATPNSEVYSADFDGDGRSDIVVSHRGAEDPDVPLRDVLYLLRDSAP